MTEIKPKEKIEQLLNSLGRRLFLLLSTGSGIMECRCNSPSVLRYGKWNKNSSCRRKELWQAVTVDKSMSGKRNDNGNVKQVNIKSDLL